MDAIIACFLFLWSNATPTALQHKPASTYVTTATHWWNCTWFFVWSNKVKERNQTLVELQRCYANDMLWHGLMSSIKLVDCFYIIPLAHTADAIIALFLFLWSNNTVEAALLKLPPWNATTATCWWHCTCWFLLEQTQRSERNRSEKGGSALMQWHCCNKCHEQVAAASINTVVAPVDCFFFNPCMHAMELLLHMPFLWGNAAV